MRLRSRNLRPHKTDARARSHAKRLAEDWRAAGLAVDVVEYVDTPTDAGGYTVTARSATSVLSCRCQSWWARTWIGRRRPVWTILVSVRSKTSDGDSPPAALSTGATAAWAHDRAWEKVHDWIDGAGALPATLDEALAALR